MCYSDLFITNGILSAAGQVAAAEWLGCDRLAPRPQFVGARSEVSETFSAVIYRRRAVRRGPLKTWTITSASHVTSAVRVLMVGLYHTHHRSHFSRGFLSR